MKKILIIGSGPIVIGQGAEFDYAGTQACLSLKEEGYEVILVNSNPATIMTDKTIADKVYMEPLTVKFVGQIIRKERPDAIIPTLGGQTAINLCMELQKYGVLKECNVEVLGTTLENINKGEDRDLFRDLCLEIGEPIIDSKVCETYVDACEFVKEISFPIVLRPAFTLGGSGGGFVNTSEELEVSFNKAKSLSPTRQVLVEKSLLGIKEVEYEIIRDKDGNMITVCNMENIDPVGVHTGDSMVVAPSLTLSNKEYQMLRTSSLKIVDALNIVGGCNVQFAYDYINKLYYIIEVNPRVSRSSALASKATGYPIAYVSAKLALGMRLDEIKLKNTLACYEPTLDYVVTKFPRFPFDKFRGIDRSLTTQMKATGEIMSIGRTFEESFLKGLRSMECENDYIPELDTDLTIQDDLTIFRIANAIRQNKEVVTNYDEFFVNKMRNIINMENKLSNNFSIDVLIEAKKMGFSDKVINKYADVDATRLRSINSIKPVYKMIDSCASEFSSYIPYFYSTYESENESIVTTNKKVVVLGSGPIRIGQGVEFDYATVHAIKAIKEKGYEAIVINCNPSTVSTDYTISDKLYFEPLTVEDIMNVIELEKPYGVIVQLGGQTPINLVDELNNLGVKILGTSAHSFNMAEDRELFNNFLDENDILRPQAITITKGGDQACELNFPLMLRPSFVLGGAGMQIVYNKEQYDNYFLSCGDIDILVDQYIKGIEIEVDAVCDGEKVFIPGIMQHIEQTGVHSGDSIMYYPSQLSEEIKQKIVDITSKIGIGLQIIGLLNIQFIYANDNIYIIEVNPRASRSLPFISKITNTNIANIATKVILGDKLENEVPYLVENNDKYYVKTPTFCFGKIKGLDTFLSPEMKSTGEAIGYDKTLSNALYKSLVASGLKMYDWGTVFLTFSDEQKEECLYIAKTFYDLGFNIIATDGTARFLKSNNIKAREISKLHEDKNDIINLIQDGVIKYVVNINSEFNNKMIGDGYFIRTTAAIHNVYTFTSIQTVDVILQILKERSINVSKM